MNALKKPQLITSSVHSVTSNYESPPTDGHSDKLYTEQYIKLRSWEGGGREGEIGSFDWLVKRISYLAPGRYMEPSMKTEPLSRMYQHVHNSPRLKQKKTTETHKIHQVIWLAVATLLYLWQKNVSHAGRVVPLRRIACPRTKCTMRPLGGTSTPK